MTRAEIISAFRVDNPDLTANVVTDAQLHSHLLTGDKEVCAITRCIVSDVVFHSVASTSVYDTKYDLTTNVPKFFDIDDFPGGGVSFNDKPLDKTTVAELDKESSSWRIRTAGTPKKWYRRGKFLYFDRPILTAALDIRVYTVLVSDDFNNDNLMPFNNTSMYEPFHQVLTLYLKWKAKPKVGDLQGAATAKSEFYDYCQWMKKQIGGNKFGPIYLRPQK